MDVFLSFRIEGRKKLKRNIRFAGEKEKEKKGEFPDTTCNFSSFSGSFSTSRKFSGSQRRVSVDQSLRVCYSHSRNLM